MSDPAAPPPARSRSRRLPLWLARLLARLLRRSGIVTSVLLGLASVLIAFSAYQASQYGDASAQNDSLANRIAVDNINQAQEDYAEHLVDSEIWVAIVTSGETVEESPLGALLSPRWLDAVERTGVNDLDRGDDGRLVLPLDDRYFQELQVESQAYLEQLARAYDDARAYDSVSARITGASIMYSAALLLLTVASTTGRSGGRLALNGGALLVMITAVVIGWAPII